MTRARGFSLLEILAALALLSLVLLGVYAGLQTVTRATHSGTAVSQRMDEIRAAQGYLRQTLTRSLAYPWARGQKRGDRPTVFSGGEREMSFVAPAPGYLAAMGVQLQQLRLSGDENHYQLEVIFAPLASRHASPVVPGEPEVLVSGIRKGHFYYNGSDDNGRPLGWQTHWDYPYRLPDMVGVALELNGEQRWPVVEIPLRMDPAAMNVIEGVYRLNSNQTGP
ncbi:MAG TPA: prepilin-type N-terminal cleavage/methylation domain-containing protein [Luteibacter sp.]|jgi:general secretion pathway protein J|nr:prepilin-type N-terminal cleavage/methylation domain-containing protein [Luteibacter sp.]